MASENTINQPRIDHPFVKGDGRLTEWGYTLLTQIVRRVGGTVGEVLNGRELTAAIEELQLQPLQPDLTPSVEALRNEIGVMPMAREHVQQSDLPPDVFSLMAELDALRKRVEALEIGYQV